MNEFIMLPVGMLLAEFVLVNMTFAVVLLLTRTRQRVRSDLEVVVTDVSSWRPRHAFAHAFATMIALCSIICAISCLMLQNPLAAVGTIASAICVVIVIIMFCSQKYLVSCANWIGVNAFILLSLFALDKM
jgi:hypothetical protein